MLLSPMVSLGNVASNPVNVALSWVAGVLGKRTHSGVCVCVCV